MEAGHADNALPQRASATVNCRLLPGVSIDEVRQTLVTVLADPQISVVPVRQGVTSDSPPLDGPIRAAIEKVSKQFWPDIPVMPVMSAGGTSARFLRNAGIPTYGTSGLAADIFDNRAHGRDERVLVASFFKGQEYLYRLVKELTKADVRS